MLTKISIEETQKIINSIKNNQIIILPSDSIYGISASALDYNNLIRINKIKQRNLYQHLIILFASYEQLLSFIDIDDNTLKQIHEYEKNNINKPISFLIEVQNLNIISKNNLKDNKILFRVVKHKILQKIIKQSGPIYSTSVNLNKENPIIDISKLNYFEGIDLLCYDIEFQNKTKPSIIYDVNNKTQIR